MFLTKLKTTKVALLVGVSTIGIGGGLLRYGLAAGQVEGKASLVQGPKQKPKQEKKDSSKPGAIQKEGEEAAPGGEVKAPDILKAFETNAALFDEKFNEKRVAVTGKMTRIFRNKPPEFANPGYVLEMVCGEPEPWVVVRFQFTDKDRKELAQFAENQMLTIEGQCQVKPAQPPPQPVLGGGLPGFPGPQGVGLPGFPGQQGPGLGGEPPQPDIIF